MKKIAYMVFLIVITNVISSYTQDRFNDSLALVEFYDSCGGMFWSDVTTNNWKSDSTIDMWSGVFLTGDRVTRIMRVGKNVSGKIPELFTNLTLLEKIYFANNAITAVPDSIGKLLLLKVFGLKNNKLSLIPNNFSNLINFQVLGLASNLLTTIPDIGGFVSLKWLDLSFNNLQSIPSGFTEIESLTVMYLNSNRLESLPDFSNFTKLKKVNLAGNNLTMLPEFIGNSPDIAVLIIDTNNLTSLPASIVNLVNDSILSMSNNNFTSLPDEIGHMSGLKYIFADNNAISTLPANLTNLSALRKLLLKNNQLTTLPTFLSEITTLERLDIRRNKLTSLPAELASLPIINHLDFADNNFVDMPNFIDRMKTLETIYIDRNSFGFDDLELAYECKAPRFSASPQDSFGVYEELFSFLGDTLNFDATLAGTKNRYFWYRGTTLILDSVITPLLRVEDINHDDSGVYHCTVKSDSVSNVSILQRTTTIHIASLNLVSESINHTVKLTWDNPNWSLFGKYSIFANGVFLDSITIADSTSYVYSGYPSNVPVSFRLSIVSNAGMVRYSEYVVDTIKNNIPEITSPDTASVDEDSFFEYTATATDADGDLLIYSFMDVPSWSTIDENVLSGTPHSEDDDFTFLLIVSDGELSDTMTVNIVVHNINQTPVISPIGNQSVNEEESLTLSITATDLDGDDISLSTTTLPSNATFTDNSDGTGTFTFSPNHTQSGEYSVTFTASDGSFSDEETIIITVVNVNREPVLSQIDNQSLNEGESLTIPITSTDPDGDNITLSTTTLPSNATFTDNSDGTGTLSFSPDFTQSKEYTIIFTASDGDLSDDETITITVIGVNQPPVLSPIGNQSLNEGESLTIPITSTDPDGDNITLSTTTLPSNATFTDNSDGTGTLAFSPDFTQSKEYTIVFTASDGDLSDDETITITVIDVNQPPVLSPIGAKEGVAGELLEFTVVANDPDSDVLTMSLLDLPTGAVFVDNGDGNGLYSWVPDNKQVGTYSLTFKVSDGGAEDDETITITIDNAVSTLDKNNPVKTKLHDLLIAPNPISLNDDEIVFTFPFKSGMSAQLFLYDKLGSLIYQKSFEMIHSHVDNDVVIKKLPITSGIKRIFKSGTCLAIVKIVDQNGVSSVCKKVLGVKLEYVK